MDLQERPDPSPQGHGEDDVFDPAPHRPTSRALMWTILLAAAVIAALVVAGVVPRLAKRATEREDAVRIESEVARVVVVKPVAAAGGKSVLLPSSVEPLQETVVYARTSGYVRKWTVDIGDSVKQGQVMAELDTPDLDQELRQAQAAAAQSRAMIAQAKTQLELARTTTKRYATLGEQGVASQQESDEKKASFAAQGANVDAAVAALTSAMANVQKFQDLKSYAMVTAPFAGVVTSRTTENGQLVTAGSGAGQALFKVAQIDVVRVYVNVPQIYAPGVKVGETTPVSVREYPNRKFIGTVARTARELNTATRTLLTEVRIPNADGALISGMYAQVLLDVNRATSPMLLPATAMVVNAQGTRVATVNDGAIHWRVVEVESDLGDQIAIASGIGDGDSVVVAPNEKLSEGLKVIAEEAKPQ